MRTTIIAMATFMAAIAIAAPAQAANHRPANHRPAYERTYLSGYAEVVHRHGVKAVGCNLVTKKYDNLCHGTKGKARVLKSITTIRRLLTVPRPKPIAAPVSTPSVAPTASVAATPSATSTAPSAAGNTAQGSGNYAIPESIVMCESGGDYGAVNPSSGAYGAYQILPSTSAGLGCNMATPAGQDACARKVWATQGRGAWVC